MSTTYKVAIEFETKGDFENKIGGASTKLGAANHAAMRFSETMMGLGSRVMAPIDAVVGKIAGLGASLAKIGTAAGVGAAVYGVSSLNNELEKTQISMAAIFNANGAASSIQDGMELAAGQMAKMRKDAAELPGEFQDLANIMKGIAVPGMKGGMDADALRTMSAKLMAAGAVTGLPMDMVAREAAQLMEGRSGAHNVLGMRLAGLSGAKAEKFNQLSSGDRMKILGEELDKYAPAIQVFKKSFDGISSTLLDNAKQFLGAATGPLFEHVKVTMSNMNIWFDQNHDKIIDFADDVGRKLGEAFRWGKRTIEEWWPVLATFAKNAYDKLSEIWKSLDINGGSAQSFKDFLKAPESIDKIITVLKLYIAAKGVGMLAGGALGGVQFASQVSSMLGSSGASAAATAASGAASGAGTGALAGVSTSVAGVGLTGGAALAAGLAAATAAVVSWGFAVDQAAKLYAETRRDISANVNASADALVRSMVEVDYTNKAYQEGMQYLIDVHDDVSASELMMAMAAREAAESLEQISQKKTEKFNQDVMDESMLWIGQMVAKNPAYDPNATDKDAKKKGSMHPGGGGQTIQKVEIVVTSNQDPSRIARRVLGEIQSLQRNPRSSGHVPNWSGADPLGATG